VRPRFEIASERLFIVVSLLVLGGCGTHGLERPQLAIPADQRASVTFIRISRALGMAVTHTVTLDGERVFGLRSGEHATLPVAAGRRVFGVECGPGMRLPAVLTLDVAAGGEYFINVNVAADCATMVEIPPAFAKS